MNDTDLEIMSRQERAAEYARLSAWLVEVLRLPRLELPAELHRALDRLRRIDALDMEDLSVGLHNPTDRRITGIEARPR